MTKAHDFNTTYARVIALSDSEVHSHQNFKERDFYPLFSRLSVQTSPGEKLSTASTKSFSMDLFAQA